MLLFLCTVHQESIMDYMSVHRSSFHVEQIGKYGFVGIDIILHDIQIYSDDIHDPMDLLHKDIAMTL